METYLLRKGSPGIAGSFENAEHHAKAAVPLIHAAQGVIMQLSPYIKRWGQGKNIHVLEALDGRKLCFRPWHAGDKWGIEVKIQVSRSIEVPIMTFDKITKTTRLYILMRDFFKVKENFYMRAKEQEEVDKNEYKYRFVLAETSLSGKMSDWKPVKAGDPFRSEYLRCSACKSPMRFHRGPEPHFEHKESMEGKCFLYQFDSIHQG